MTCAAGRVAPWRWNRRPAETRFEASRPLAWALCASCLLSSLIVATEIHAGGGPGSSTMSPSAAPISPPSKTQDGGVERVPYGAPGLAPTFGLFWQKNSSFALEPLSREPTTGYGFSFPGAQINYTNV